MIKKGIDQLNVELLLYNIKKKFNLTNDDILTLSTEEKEMAIPITIFSNKLGMLESISLYMHDILNLKFNQIAKLLHRDYQTIWTSYRKAKKKLKK